MRVLLAGSPSERARLKATLNGGAIEIAGEFDTLTDARVSAIEADAILLASRDNGSRSSDPEYHEALTPREVQVLELLAEGLPNKAIARRLDISDQTVKFHVASISGKLGAANRTDAVRRAARRGLITL